MDRGHCAPPSGGRLIKGTGQWQFEASNLELSMILGDELNVVSDVGVVAIGGLHIRLNSFRNSAVNYSWDVQNLVKNGRSTCSHGSQILIFHRVSQTFRIS